MFISKIVVILFLTSVISAHIAVNIDPEDLDQVSDFFFQAFINQHQHQNNPILQRRRIISMIKKTSSGIIKLIGIMLTLVSANFFTVKLNLFVPIQQQPEIIVKNISNNEPLCEMCVADSGCKHNLCWRACYSDKKSSVQLWCYTSPNPVAREFQYCDYSDYCSPCWECIETCHT